MILLILNESSGYRGPAETGGRKSVHDFAAHILSTVCSTKSGCCEHTWLRLGKEQKRQWILCVNSTHQQISDLLVLNKELGSILGSLALG